MPAQSPTNAKEPAAEQRHEAPGPGAKEGPEKQSALSKLNLPPAQAHESRTPQAMSYLNKLKAKKTASPSYVPKARTNDELKALSAQREQQRLKNLEASGLAKPQRAYQRNPRLGEIEPITQPADPNAGFGWEGIMRDRYAGQDADHHFIEAIPGGKLSKTLEGYGGYYDDKRRVYVLPKRFAANAAGPILSIPPHEYDQSTGMEAQRELASPSTHDRIIKRDGSDVLVKTQYGGKLSEHVRRLGGVWDRDAKRWRVPAAKEPELKQYIRANPHHYERRQQPQTYADALRMRRAVNA